MNCRSFQRQISSFVDGELTATASEALQDHLAACAVCRSRYERVAALDRALKVMPAERPRPDLAGEVHARIARAAAHRNEQSAFPGWIRVPLAATIVLLALGLGNLAGRSMLGSVNADQPEVLVEIVAPATDYSLADLVMNVSSEENGQ